MKVHVPRHESRAIDRVALALRKYAPRALKFVDEADADLVVIHVTGRLDHLEQQLIQIRQRKQAYALIQYVLASTQRPDPADWMPLWESAKVVWSYLDLAAISKETWSVSARPSFYHAPLGCEADVFNADAIDLATPYAYLVMTHGPSSLCEGVRECAKAAQRVGGEVFHLGPKLGRLPWLTPHENITDAELVEAYQDTAFVCGLRRIEGFELPCVEGLFCGARPILFDQPHYRQWYGSMAEYIPEGSRQQVEDALVELWQRPSRMVTQAEISLARQRFHWPVIVRGFWERV